MENYKLETGGGDRFQEVAKKAQEIAKLRKVIVEFDFNGVQCLVSENTCLEWLFRDYKNAHIMEWKTVGHDCPFIYDCDTEVELRRRQLKRAIERKKDQKRRDKEDAKAKKKFDKQIKGIVLEIVPSKEEEYKEYVEKNSTDGYSRAVIDYGESWARLMQKEIAKGKSVKECALDTRKGLGFMGITGFQYGCVVRGLAEFWKYGDDLRKWHNNKYGVSEDEEGTVNPAVITIKTN